MPLGVPHGHTFLVPYDPDWPTHFEIERARLWGALSPQALAIEHIGSTAVPGLRAKPIIDIAIGVQSHGIADDWQESMAALGYDYPGDIGLSHHRIYGRDPDIRRFLVHVVDLAGSRWEHFLRFRNLLIADPRLAAAYEEIKTDAAKQYPTGKRSRYTDAKARFIDEVLSGQRRPD